MPRRGKTALCLDHQWVGRADCRHCPIRQQVIFSEVPDTRLDQQLWAIDNYTYTPKCRLYSPDDPANAVFTLRKGTVKLSLQLNNGGYRVVRLLYPGDVLGLEALLNQPYRHTAISLQEVDVCRIPVSIIEQFRNEMESFRKELMTRWQRGLDQADHFITQFSTGSAQSRMARLLLYLKQHSGQKRVEAFSREDLGEMLGISTETASRIIAEFKRSGLIEERGGSFLYPDIDRLEAVTEVD